MALPGLCAGIPMNKEACCGSGKSNGEGQCGKGRFTVCDATTINRSAPK